MPISKQLKEQGSLALRIVGCSENDVCIQEYSFLQKHILLVFILGLMLMTLFLTGSRGGIASFFIGLLVFVSILYWKLKNKRILAVIGSIVFVALLFGQRAGLVPVWERFALLPTQKVVSHWRTKHNKAALELVQDYPVLGSGLGTYESVYPPYQPEKDQRLRTHLHNDWLELMADVGIVGFLVVLGAYHLVFVSNLVHDCIS